MQKCLLPVCTALFLSQSVLAQTATSEPVIPANVLDRAYGQAPEKGPESLRSLQPSSPQLGSKVVPKLKITWNCAQCEINEQVPPLIEQTYVDVVAQLGYTISDSETADVTITDFRQRPPGVRVMFGAMAGKDRLGVNISYRGNQHRAEENTSNAWIGMNALCDAVGKKSLSAILAIIRSSAPTTN